MLRAGAVGSALREMARYGLRHRDGERALFVFTILSSGVLGVGHFPAGKRVPMLTDVRDLCIRGHIDTRLVC
jgi:hypothetical protein